MTVIIDALNGVTRFRPRSNVFEERSERVLPALADGNSSPAVVRKILRVRIQTTSPQVQPYLIFRRVALAVRALSARQDLAGQQSLCAAATLRMPVAEARTPDHCFSAAVTTTTPQTKSLVRFSPRRPKHHQPTKPLPGHVREAAHCVLACRTTKPSRPATHAVGPCKELHAASLTDAGHATLGLHLETHPFAVPRPRVVSATRGQLCAHSLYLFACFLAQVRDAMVDLARIQRRELRLLRAQAG
jgi:hypothetical protein